MWLWALIGCGSDGTVDVPGDPARFDPIAAMPAIAAFAGEGAALRDLRVLGLRADGTVDLTAPPVQGSVDASFVRRTAAPADAPPLGAGGSPDGQYWESVTVRLFEPGQWRHVSTGSSEYDYMHRGMARDASPQGSRPDGEDLPLPTCDLKKLWAALDAPAGAVAYLHYDARGYELMVRDTELRVSAGPDCAVKSP